MEPTMTEDLIKKVTKKDILHDFYNKYFREMVSAEININIYKDIIKHKGEKEVVGEQPMVMGQGKDGRPMQGIVKVKAIDALTAESGKFDNYKRVVETIEQLLKNA